VKFNGYVVSSVGLALVTLATPVAAMELTCTGVLTAQSELQLKPNPGSSLWCDALFTGKEYGVTKLDAEKRVRATCAEGDRCQVKGTVEGHGVFYWTKITSVKKF
jgi:hypothetical protein